MLSTPEVAGLEVTGCEGLARDALRVVLEGWRAADPYVAVARHVRAEGPAVAVGERTYRPGGVHVVGFGKASPRMLEALCSVLGSRVVGGIVINPVVEGELCGVEVLRGDHPLPGERTLQSSMRLINYLESAVGEDDLVLTLISGGGSALFEVPEEGLSIDDVAEVTRLLMARGADIYELNTVRKHLSRVKGGKLLRFVRGEVASLIISDVVGDDLSVVASGPTYPDRTTFRDAYEVMRSRGVYGEVPESVRRLVARGLSGLVGETLKPDDPLFRRAYNMIVASNIASLRVMEGKARELGYNTLLLTPYLTGEAREVGKVLAGVIKSVAALDTPVRKPAALIAGGETTVTVRGDGVGGRNQELCLSLTIEIRDVGGAVALCVGSDGMDGVSPAAGAITSSKVFGKALESGLDPLTHLRNNDSYTFFRKLGLAVLTGYTGTNVNDFFIALIS
ncbi:MAG: glycerate kinase [Zestosphaera sp.]